MLGTVKEEAFVNYLNEHAAEFVAETEEEAVQKLAIAQRNLEAKEKALQTATDNYNQANNNYDYVVHNDANIPANQRANVLANLKNTVDELYKTMQNAEKVFQESKLIVMCWGYVLDLLRGNSDLSQKYSFDTNLKRYENEVKAINDSVKIQEQRLEYEKELRDMEYRNFVDLSNKYGYDAEVVKEKTETLKELNERIKEAEKDLNTLKTSYAPDVLPDKSETGLLATLKNFYNEHKTLTLAAAGVMLYLLLSDNND